MRLMLLVCVIFSLIGCASKDKKNTQDGAVIGAAAGAVAGAMIAGAGGDQKKAMLIGGAIGGAIGATIGKKLDDQARELKKIAETKRTQHGIVTKLKGDITFASGKAEVTSDAKQRISKMAKIIKKYPEDRLVITGHTDSTGSKDLNSRLSAQRAQAVKDLMVQGGVPSKYIKIVGAADSNPVASNNTLAGRSANRRVEIAITMVENKKKSK